MRTEKNQVEFDDGLRHFDMRRYAGERSYSFEWRTFSTEPFVAACGATVKYTKSNYHPSFESYDHIYCADCRDFLKAWYKKPTAENKASRYKIVRDGWNHRLERMSKKLLSDGTVKLSGSMTPQEMHQKKMMSSLTCELLSQDSRIEMNDHETVYLPTKSKINMMTGPISNPHHQLAHILEMNDLERITVPDWGMPTTGLDCEYLKPGSFFSAAIVELRVRAIEACLNGGDVGYNNRLFTNIAWADGAKKRLPYGRWKSFEELNDYADNLWCRTVNAWTEEKIRHEWNVRLNYLREWMETK